MDATKPPCRYGNKCYRKNPAHFEEFSHPDEGSKFKPDGGVPPAKRVKVVGDDDDDDDGGGNQVITISSGDDSSEKSLDSPVRSKLHPRSSIEDGGEPRGSTSPHSPLFYLTKVRGIDHKYNDRALSLKDILAMGDLMSSIQFNYMFDIPWLVQQYPKEKRNLPLLLVHGDQKDATPRLQKEAEPYRNIKLFPAKLNIPFGTHHSKMMLLRYPEGIRVVIHTANLIEKDWDQKTQGVWLSPVFPRSVNSSTTSKPCDDFKSDLIEYLEAYGGRVFNKWIDAIREHDMSGTRVRLVASVPGAHVREDASRWGHLKLRKVLSLQGPSAEKVDESWPVIGQFSSIGSLGPKSDSWLTSEWLLSLSSCRKDGTSLHKYPNLQLIFPTVSNVRNSLEGYAAGGSIPYSYEVKNKQPYLTKNYFHIWKADCTGRSRAAPHIKTYCRLSKDSSKVTWFLLTSANLSKAAWGGLEKKGTQLRIRSYEIGVLFLPSSYDTDQDQYFSIKQSDNPPLSSGLQIPYDVPPVVYDISDHPWVWNVHHAQPDSHGHTYDIS